MKYLNIQRINILKVLLEDHQERAYFQKLVNARFAHVEMAIADQTPIHPRRIP